MDFIIIVCISNQSIKGMYVCAYTRGGAGGEDHREWPEWNNGI
jgi:hypothetical protein